MGVLATEGVHHSIAKKITGQQYFGNRYIENLCSFFLCLHWIIVSLLHQWLIKLGGRIYEKN